MITILKNTEPLKPIDPCADPDQAIDADRLEMKLFIGREIDGETCLVPIDEVLELPQIHVFVPKKSYRNS